MTACLQCSFDPDATVLASWSFTIPRDLPSLNQRIHNGAKGWQYRKVRDAWTIDMTVMRMTHRMAALPMKRRVTLIRLYSGRMREMDKANIDTKACVDSMVTAGLIVDDKPQWLELHVKQERGKERGTRVVIEELAL